MQLTLNGKNIDITAALRSYVNEKLERIVKHNGQIMNVKVTLSVNKNPSVKNNSTAEVTCFLNGAAVKITECAETMYAAIDLLADKLDRRVRETKKKLVGKGKHTSESIRVTAIEEEAEGGEDEEEAESVL
jgi:putative sigma-54 modulation protein